MSELRFTVTENLQCFTWVDGSDEPDLSTELSFEKRELTKDELMAHFEKRNFSNISGKMVKDTIVHIEKGSVLANGVYDNENNEFSEDGVQKQHQIHLEKVVDGQGNELDDKLAGKLWKKVIYEHCEHFGNKYNTSNELISP